MNKRNFILIAFAFIVLQATLLAQSNSKAVAPPEVNSFAPILGFLSSNWMEGREAGTKGGFMAADYVSSMMQVFGLSPFGDKKTKKAGYFQDFEIVQYKTLESSLAFIERDANSQSVFQLNQGVDYKVSAGVNGSDAEAAVVFAGYGVVAADKGYDDYKGMDVKGKIVVVLDGFPGHGDTTSAGWKTFWKSGSEAPASIETKLQNARIHGALALILLDAEGKFEPFKQAQSNRLLLQSTMNSVKNTEEEYEEFYHTLPNDTASQVIPCFRLGSSAAKHLISGTGINFIGFESKTAKTVLPASQLMKDKTMRFSVMVKSEPILVRNVLGIIPGKDKTKYIVLGGHYDHLGTHNGHIFNGSDDNASGASGMLALAKTWAESGVQPACNLIFASWSGEEEGLLGSQYFVEQMNIKPKDILLYINMDMISRSVIEDTTRRQLSIGTRTSDKYIREMAKKNNSTLSHPFILDLWDVTGHSGSDYASFTAKNIPIMTYNTGLHNDYHTPRDISANADLVKMGDVLKMVNSSLMEVLNNIPGK
ncbi:MAG: M20/M25/M40 family metallo-hydrolase [Bacteroidota bacterium]